MLIIPAIDLKDGRCVRLKQRKRAKAITVFLHGLGVPWDQCWTTAACGKGWWRMAQTPAAHQGMSNAWFKAQGLVDPLARYLQLQDRRKPPDTVSTSGGVGGRERQRSLLPDLRPA